MSDLHALVGLRTGTVRNVIVGYAEVDGYDTVPLPAGVWIGFVRQADGSFVDPNPYVAPVEDPAPEASS